MKNPFSAKIKAHDVRLNEKTERPDYGFIDRLGRKVGARVHTYEQDHEELPANYEGYCWRGTPGHKWIVIAHNTRNGHPYGSATFHRTCSTEEARDKAILKYLNDSSRQLRKKFAEYNR